MSLHKSSQRWEDFAIILMVMLMGIIIYFFDG